MMVPLDNGVKQGIRDAYASSTLLTVSDNELTVIPKREYFVVARLCAKLAMKANVLRLRCFELLE